MKKNTAHFSIVLTCLLIITMLMASCKENSKEVESGTLSSDVSSSIVSIDSSTSAIVSETNNSSGSTSASSVESKTPEKTVTKVDPAKYKGTTVRYATWKDPAANEDGIVVSKFQKKYGIKVKIDIVPQGTYIAQLTSMIAAGNSPDICFDNVEYPASLSVLQPIDAANLDLTDPIWDTAAIKNATIKGKIYEVNTLGNIWSEVDCVFFNKKLLEDNGITTPEELYKAGKWTWDAMYSIMKKTAALGSDYRGGYIDGYILAASVGTGFFKFENGKVTTGINDPMMTKTYQFLANCYQEGLLAAENHSTFVDGKAALEVTNAFGLKKTGYFANMDPSHIGFTYLPDYDAQTKAKTTSINRGWGIVKGAQNPVAAGIFLRYYLDVNNYDLKSAFINQEASTFFFKLTSVGSQNREIYISNGVGHALGAYDEFENTYLRFYKNTPDQIPQALSSVKNVVNDQVVKANEFISKHTK